MDVTIGLAFFAGLVSFISPCVLPLVPAYIGYMGGRMTQTVSTQVSVSDTGEAVMTPNRLLMRFNTLLHGMAFVGGFTLVFVVLGVVTTAFVQIIGGQNIGTITSLISRIGGIFIIIFGFHFMGVLPSFFRYLRSEKSNALNYFIVGTITVVTVGALWWGFSGHLAIWDQEVWRDPFNGSIKPTIWAPIIGLLLSAGFLVWMFISDAFTQPQAFLTKTTNQLDAMFYADTRREMDVNANEGLVGSALMGVIFAAGWTPCIGPIYGTILTMSADSGQVMTAIPLLTAYSLGLGIPFLLSALMLDSAQGVIRRMNRHMRAIKLVSGGFLIAMGVLIASGQLTSLSQQLSGQFAEFSILVEECSLGWIEGDVYFNQLGDCLGGVQSIEAIRESNGITNSEAFLPVTNGVRAFAGTALSLSG